MKKANLFDKAISLLSPRHALKREQANAALTALRNYEAAGHGRRTEGWHTMASSANVETLYSLAVLRDRARDLGRNNPYASIAVDVIETNTIGTGIRPSIKAKTDAQSKKIQEAWKNWAESTDCDFDGHLDFYGLQALVMRTVAESGEAIIKKKRVPYKKGGVPYKLQVLEGDFIDHNRNNPMLPDGGFILQGVEFNKRGELAAYWLYDRHPAEAYFHSAISTRHNADEILHVYRVKRPGQVRGVPFGVSAMLKLRDFDEYEDAQLVRQKIAACYAVFIQDPAADTLTASTDDDLPEKVEPGMIEHLSAGKTVAFSNPPAAQGYNEYTRKVLQSIAVGYGVTYEAITGDLSNVNFSSGRMGWLEFHRRVTGWQKNMIIPMMCAPAFKWFIEGGELAGLFEGGLTPSWTPPRREMIDPTKEVKGINEQIRAGLMSWQEAVRQQGFEPSEVLKEITDNHKALADAGIMLDSDPRADSTRTNLHGAEFDTSKNADLSKINQPKIPGKE